MVWRKIVVVLTCIFSVSCHEIRSFYESCEACCNPDDTRAVIRSSGPSGGTHRFIPTVDIFFTIDRPKEYPYIENGHFWAVLMVLDRLSVQRIIHNSPVNATRSDTRIHIFSSDERILKQTTDMGPNYYAWDFKQFANETKSFFEMYKKIHYSVNKLEYEFLCFNRWQMYGRAVELWNAKTNENQLKINRIITADLDVLFFTNAAVMFDNALAALTPNYFDSMEDNTISEDEKIALDGFESLLMYLGATSLWSSHGLCNFSQYMRDYFASKPLEEMKKMVKGLMGYFSDMIIIESFMKEANQTRTRSICLDYYASYRSREKWNSMPFSRQLVSLTGCFYAGDGRYYLGGDTFHFAYNQSAISSLQGGQVYHMRDNWHALDLISKIEGLPLCLLHFQGKETKGMLYVYSKVFLHATRDKLYQTFSHQEIERNGSQLCDDDHYLLQKTSNDRSVYLIYHGQRHLIPSGKIFEELGFQWGAIHTVPKWILEFYPLSSDVNMDWHEVLLLSHHQIEDCFRV